MLYMLEESECTNTLIRLLVPAETSSHQIYLPVTEYTDEDKKESFSLDNLGYLIFYHLQVIMLTFILRIQDNWLEIKQHNGAKRISD